MTSGPGQFIGADPSTTAPRIHSALSEGMQLPRLSGSPAALSVDGAYEVAKALRSYRSADGARVVGRKLGFTNRDAWARYGVDACIVGDVWSDTLVACDDAGRATVSIAGLTEPRIEPEIVLGIDGTPAPGAGPEALAGHLSFIALGFEIVRSPYPGWSFDGADAIAAGALHGRLVTGPHVEKGSDAFANLVGSLPDLGITLKRGEEAVGHGLGRNALGGPLSALAHLVTLTAGRPTIPPLAAGEVITTGTLTEAKPVAPGETWTVAVDGDWLPSLTATFT